MQPNLIMSPWTYIWKVTKITILFLFISAVALNIMIPPPFPPINTLWAICLFSLVHKYLVDFPSKFHITKKDQQSKLGCVDFDSLFLLRSLGTKCSSILETKSQTLEACVSPLLVPQTLLRRNYSHTCIFEDKLGILDQLQKQLVASFRPKTPDNFYQFKATVNSLNSVPDVKSVLWQGQCPSAETDHGFFDTLLERFGGVRLFLFLFAKVFVFHIKVFNQ